MTERYRAVLQVQAGVTVEAADRTFRVYDNDPLRTEVPATTARPISRLKVRKPEPPRQKSRPN
ncbi:hypothetical protein Rhe02_03310 [Rhizocola hellebori]|uniref:Uncharacterized protein n=1 Tax=Rhizocola hellebori TaxID=1392758 RepID=A0A8J3Q269_9ACTN|nr:hypothetical protein [Rhizocola hellebori]GIH02264.1 hypothetical protein Rhe02_03310 [Rhizocola hellebori]